MMNTKCLKSFSVGGGAGEVPDVCGPYRRGAPHEEDHVGPVLVRSPALLQVPLYLRQGQALHQASQGGGQKRKGQLPLIITFKCLYILPKLNTESC